MTDHRDHLTPDEQYLWDGTGRPDEATAQIESALRPLRYSADPPAFARRSLLRPLALAAGVLIAALAGYALFPRPTPPAPRITWTIAAAAGDVRLGEPRTLKSALTARDITIFDGASLTLHAGRASTVRFENAAHLEVVEGADERPWLTIHDGEAFVQVADDDKPIRVDLHGCAVALRPGLAASLRATPQETSLTCKAGEAHIDWPERQTRVLGPATCTIDAARGPSLPLPIGAAPEACNTVDALDQSLRAGGGNMKAVDALLMAFLDSAAPSDAPTLWNLLHRVPPGHRRHVRDTLAALIEPPASVNADQILKLDPAAMEEWWKACVQAAGKK